MDIKKLKYRQLEDVARYRERLKAAPSLRWLFFEITNRCNLSCKHCGSNCTGRGQSLALEDVEKTLTEVRAEKPMICLTGGEPMLHPQIFEMGQLVRSMGLFWGMTTNATLINEEAVVKLRRSGLSTVSVSLDGMEQSHDRLRGKKGAWRSAVHGLQLLQEAGFAPQVTTVVHRDNIHELDQLYTLLCEMGISSWRPINIEPIGRACESGHLMLKPEQFAYLLSYIQKKRFDHECKMEVTYGCSHYLGVARERMVRDHYFMCGAGNIVASVRSNGDICACLDIINRQELVQGNISRDNFMEVWRNGFQVFRGDRTADCEKCINCSERFICGGDSAHTWDYENHQPLLCMKEINKNLCGN